MLITLSNVNIFSVQIKKKTVFKIRTLTGNRYEMLL